MTVYDLNRDQIKDLKENYLNDGIDFTSDDFWCSEML